MKILSNKNHYFIDTGDLKSLVLMPYRKSEKSTLRYAVRLNGSLTVFDTNRKSSARKVWSRLYKTMSEIDTDAIIELDSLVAAALKN